MRRAAIVSLFNVADTIRDGEVQLRLRNQYGEVLRVWPHPGMRGCRLVEFFDTRVAAAVRSLLWALGPDTGPDVTAAMWRRVWPPPGMRGCRVVGRCSLQMQGGIG